MNLDLGDEERMNEIQNAVQKDSLRIIQSRVICQGIKQTFIGHTMTAHEGSNHNKFWLHGQMLYQYWATQNISREISQKMS